MMEPFRCILASRLLLDHQLHGTQLHRSGGVAADVRKVVEDATLIAFEQIVDACLLHEVDCVLLSGDSFDPEDQGLRGPAKLIREIGRLAEHDIPVILQGGRSDLWSYWPAGLRFPPNAHRLGTSLEASVNVSRQGILQATIGVVGKSTDNQPAAGLDWQIQFPDKSGTFRTVRIPDDLGSVQGLRPHETGAHGGLLIEFDESDTPRREFIPTAPVRWERFEVIVHPEMTRDDLLQEMATRLEQTPREPCEKLWLVGWDLSGTGELLELLCDHSFRDDLALELTELDPLPNVRIHTHALRVRALLDSEQSRAGDDDLVAEYAAQIDEQFARPETALHECLAGSALGGGPWEVKIESLFAELDAGEVAFDARKMAMHWFSAHEELSS